MKDREKMIEISKQCRADWRKSPANTNEDEMLADRLIEAGFKRNNILEKCPDCGMSWLEGREDDCDNEFHAWENKP